MEVSAFITFAYRKLKGYLRWRKETADRSREKPVRVETVVREWNPVKDDGSHPSSLHLRPLNTASKHPAGFCELQ